MNQPLLKNIFNDNDEMTRAPLILTIHLIPHPNVEVVSIFVVFSEKIIAIIRGYDNIIKNGVYKYENVNDLCNAVLFCSSLLEQNDIYYISAKMTSFDRRGRKIASSIMDDKISWEKNIKSMCDFYS